MNIKKAILFFIFSFWGLISNGQIIGPNLVQNPSFEDYYQCPPYCVTGNLNYCKNWFSGHGVNGSSDYFNSCSLDLNCVLAINIQPPRTGNGMAAIALYAGYEYREYLMDELSDSLKRNKLYCAKFYTSLSNFSSGAIENIGMYFSTDTLFNFATYGLLLKQPQIENNKGIIMDTLNWVKVSGSFIANGNEKYFVIGNFRDNNHTNYIDVFFGATIPYYFFDDVSVCECENLKPKFNKDTTLCFGQQLLLKANIPKEVDSVNYTWQDSSKNSTFLVTQPGTYWVSAYIEDYKITVCDSITVSYADCTIPTLWIPNSFTPNGDGLNDKFEYANADSFIIKTYIYNRWGQMVFEGENTNFWDGTFKGKIVPLGVYAYTIEALDKRSNEKKVYSGRVTVVQ
ncbi:MAG: gliding motility-associated C-terminal domain-containing protein [Bacteroidetes bacterium]|nr:gliding motility-associated C-terminal domain-containing protein [Bacteroidota bacterium]